MEAKYTTEPYYVYDIYKHAVCENSTAFCLLEFKNSETDMRFLGEGDINASSNTNNNGKE